MEKFDRNWMMLKKNSKIASGFRATVVKGLYLYIPYIRNSNDGIIPAL